MEGRRWATALGVVVAGLSGCASAGHHGGHGASGLARWMSAEEPPLHSPADPFVPQPATRPGLARYFPHLARPKPEAVQPRPEPTLEELEALTSGTPRPSARPGLFRALARIKGGPPNLPEAAASDRLARRARPTLEPPVEGEPTGEPMAQARPRSPDVAEVADRLPAAIVAEIDPESLPKTPSELARAQLIAAASASRDAQARLARVGNEELPVDPPPAQPAPSKVAQPPEAPSQAALEDRPVTGAEVAPAPESLAGDGWRPSPDPTAEVAPAPESLAQEMVTKTAAPQAEVAPAPEALAQEMVTKTAAPQAEVAPAPEAPGETSGPGREPEPAEVAHAPESLDDPFAGLAADANPTAPAVAAAPPEPARPSDEEFIDPFADLELEPPPPGDDLFVSEGPADAATAAPTRPAAPVRLRFGGSTLPISRRYSVPKPPPDAEPDLSGRPRMPLDRTWRDDGLSAELPPPAFPPSYPGARPDPRTPPIDPRLAQPEPEPQERRFRLFRRWRERREAAAMPEPMPPGRIR